MERMLGQTDFQRDIWSMRAAGSTYDSIARQISVPISHRQIAHCLRRTALGLEWSLSCHGGNEPYLCLQDEAQLALYLSENCALNDCVRTCQVLEAAHAIKISRNIHAIEALRVVHCDHIAEEISLTI